MEIRENKCLKTVKILNLRKEDTLQAIADKKEAISRISGDDWEQLKANMTKQLVPVQTQQSWPHAATACKESLC